MIRYLMNATNPIALSCISISMVNMYVNDFIMQNRLKMKCGQPFYHKAGPLHTVRRNSYFSAYKCKNEVKNVIIIKKATQEHSSIVYIMTKYKLCSWYERH